MEKKYEVAKRQGLNWQALLIEDTQTEIKVLIQKLILDGRSYFEVNKAVVKVVEQTIKELQSQALKDSAKTSLYSFATRIYNYLKQTYQGLNWFGISALLSVSQNVGTPKQNQFVSQLAGDSAFNRAVPLDLFSKDYMKFIKERIDYLSKMEAKEDYTSRVNLRNIAEMQVREEWHEQELETLRNNGVKLVWIVPHANCSERCEKWQGKLYSLDGTSGVIDGISYQPLEKATEIYETTKSGKIYKNGCISGFNCRHTLEPYKQGNKPIEIPSRVIDRQREINTKQRYFERGVREWKERAVMFKDIDQTLYKFAKAKAKWWNDRYVAYSEKNGVAYYPSRTEII